MNTVLLRTRNKRKFKLISHLETMYEIPLKYFYFPLCIYKTICIYTEITVLFQLIHK